MSGDSVLKVTRRVRLPVDQAWQLVADCSAQQHWLGPGSRLEPVAASRLQLNDQAGPWRSGTVTQVEDEERIECWLVYSSSWAVARASTLLTISLKPHPKSGTRITAEETDLPTSGGRPAPRDDAEAFWAAALLRLQRLAGRIDARRNNPRQALIVIHGIGEQEPGVTLRGFVKGILTPEDSEIEHWSKPDRTSRYFELRRINVKASDRQVRPRTDVYELYWAHVIRDTTLSQVGSWLRHLLFRKGVPRRFRPLWLAAWFVLLVLLSLAVARAAGWWPEWASYVVSGGLVVLVATLSWRLLGRSFVVNSLGDAARYLAPLPANIEHRQAIREAGVRLLAKLHERGNLDRIVIIGHSLGSVIAYDIITQYWIATHNRHLRLPRVDNKGVTAIELNLDVTDPQTAQGLQHDAWKAARSNSQPWLVTDLVTLGSPLSAADFLMAPTVAEFERAKVERELPTCPPREEVDSGGKRRVSFDIGYDDRFGGRDKTLKCLNDAAPFAVTRWTNLHFRSSLLGDPIGGEVHSKFGDWVLDVALEPPPGRRFFLHSCYWQGTGNHIDELLAALRLQSGDELRAELRNYSPLMYLPGGID